MPTAICASPATITPEERARRQRAVDQANAHNRIEGLYPIRAERRFLRPSSSTKSTTMNSPGISSPCSPWRDACLR